MNPSSMQKPSSSSPSIRKWWYRWRYRLSALLLVIPVATFTHYFDRLALDGGARGLGEREVGEVVVGPWTVRLAEWQVQEPFRDGDAGYIKVFSMALCEDCLSQVKAAYVRVGKPRSLRAAGGLFFGTPYLQQASVRIPDKAGADTNLWITLEGWDGSVHQASIPLSQASPTTVAWMKKRGLAS
ncbi:MAG TPA: thiamine pyrophosphate-binding protein [Hydrogenophaga sp.]|nr:thiamine pyrophosphate-binding protein [Hydrogenophaga sp.]